jgi:hypothetical protein
MRPYELAKFLKYMGSNSRRLNWPYSNPNYTLVRERFANATTILRFTTPEGNQRYLAQHNGGVQVCVCFVVAPPHSRWHEVCAGPRLRTLLAVPDLQRSIIPPLTRACNVKHPVLLLLCCASSGRVLLLAAGLDAVGEPQPPLPTPQLLVTVHGPQDRAGGQ